MVSDKAGIEFYILFRWISIFNGIVSLPGQIEIPRMSFQGIFWKFYTQNLHPLCTVSCITYARSMVLLPLIYRCHLQSVATVFLLLTRTSEFLDGFFCPFWAKTKSSWQPTLSELSSRGLSHTPDVNDIKMSPLVSHIAPGIWVSEDISSRQETSTWRKKEGRKKGGNMTERTANDM